MNLFPETQYEDQTFKGLTANSTELRGINFEGCTFSQCSFKESVFQSCKFIDCVFKKCDLSLAHVDYSTFRSVRFEKTKVIGVNWVKAAWGKKEILQMAKTIDFFQSVLNYSSFMGLMLEGIQVQKCVAHEVDFSDANLTRANCTYTDFERSQFRHTDLTEADFSGATNYDISPQLNTLKKTRFSLPDAMTLLYNLDIVITASDATQDTDE